MFWHSSTLSMQTVYSQNATCQDETSHIKADSSKSMSHHLLESYLFWLVLSLKQAVSAAFSKGFKANFLPKVFQGKHLPKHCCTCGQTNKHLIQLRHASAANMLF